MLKYFEVDNFRGFDAPVAVDFTAGSYAFNGGIVRRGLVKNAIIYGRNGIGKSALGLALFDIVAHLTDHRHVKEQYLHPYCNQNTGRDRAVFRYVFDFSGEEVRYEYEKSGIADLICERLWLNGERLIDFCYAGQGEKYVKEGLAGQLNLDLPDNRLSVVKYIYRNTPTDSVPVICRLMEFCNGMLWFRSLSDGNNYAGFCAGSNSLDEAFVSKDRLEGLAAFLRENGLDYRLSLKEVEGRRQIMVTFANGAQVPFSSVASSGTKALYLLYYWKVVAFDRLSLLFIDEFDAFFHFESASNVVRLLNSMPSFQTVLTSHNTYLMRNDLTRPDCCFIMTTNRVTPLSKATDRVLREGHNLEKLYLNGAFTEP